MTTSPSASAPNDSVTGSFFTSGHNGIFVPLFAGGCGSQHFSGNLQNSDIFHRLRDIITDRASIK